jgi:hypothetical protein
MPTTNAPYVVQRSWGMSLGWVAFALFSFAFAALPVIAASSKRQPGIVMLFVIAWCAVFLGLGVCLLFSALCRIALSGGPSRLSRRARFLLLRTTTEYALDRAYLVRQWHFRKNGGDIVRDVLFVRVGRKKHRLADELICADLPGLLQWIADVTQVKTRDARHRRPIDS